MSEARPTEAPKTYTVEEAIALGFQHHQAGELQHAEQFYRQILTVEPSHPDALHLLGLIAHQVGQLAAAGQLMEKALEAQPDGAMILNGLGSVRLDQGRFQEAVSHYEKALTIQSDSAAVCNNLGAAYEGLGKVDQAVESYRKAIVAQPDMVESHNNIGRLLRDQGAYHEAETALRDALQHQPDYDEALNNLGTVLAAQGDLEEAQTCFEKCIAIRPDFFNAHNNLGVINKDMGCLEQAEICFNKVLELAPESAEAHNNLSTIYWELGRMDESLASCRRALELKPDLVNAYITYVRSQKCVSGDATLEAMAHLYQQETLPDEQKGNLAFALAKAHEDMACDEEAFRYLEEGNAVRRACFDYDHDVMATRFDAIKRRFSSDFVAARQGGGLQDKRPIFILGMPRSGTSLVEQILASHSQVHGAGELTDLAHVMVDYCPLDDPDAWFQRAGELSLDSMQEIAEKYLKRLKSFAPESAFITDKMPNNFLYLGWIRLAMPEARIIHCRRNAMDTCFSVYKTNFEGAQPFAYDLEELGRYYRLYEGLMGHWNSLFAGAIFELRYEEMVADQEGVTRRLLDHCGLSWEPGCLAFHTTKRQVATASASQVRRPIYKESVARWKRFEQQLQPLRDALESPRASSMENS
ncbi:MAG: tetratricopeptide repeat protein [Magnetococcales bacterium]|nr:tetratricopeptide repeat protein [Magnetococcales bacterium]